MLKEAIHDENLIPELCMLQSLNYISLGDLETAAAKLEEAKSWIEIVSPSKDQYLDIFKKEDTSQLQKIRDKRVLHLMLIFSEICMYKKDFQTAKMLQQKYLHYISGSKVNHVDPYAWYLILTLYKYYQADSHYSETLQKAVLTAENYHELDYLYFKNKLLQDLFNNNHFQELSLYEKMYESIALDRGEEQRVAIKHEDKYLLDEKDIYLQERLNPKNNKYLNVLPPEEEDNVILRIKLFVDV